MSTTACAPARAPKPTLSPPRRTGSDAACRACRSSSSPGRTSRREPDRHGAPCCPPAARPGTPPTTRRRRSCCGCCAGVDRTACRPCVRGPRTPSCGCDGPRPRRSSPPSGSRWSATPPTTTRATSATASATSSFRCAARSPGATSCRCWRACAELAAEEAEELDRLAGLLDPTDAPALAGAPPALARRVLRSWLRLGPEAYPPARHRCGAVLAVAAGESVACEIEGGRRVRRSQGRLAVTDAPAPVPLAPGPGALQQTSD